MKLLENCFDCRSMRLQWMCMCICLLLPAVPVHADWWNESWTGRLAVSIDTTADGAPLADAVEDATILLRLHGGNFPFAASRSDGSDLRIVADDHATVLPHWIERFDDLLQEGFVWVQIPQIAGNSRTRVWLYYGNANPGEAAARRPVFGDDAVLVYPFSSRGLNPMDQSGQQNHALNSAIRVEGSLIAGGMRLNGRMQVSVAESPSLTFASTQPFTATVWLSPDTHATTAAVLSRSDGSNFWVLGLDAGVPYFDYSINGVSGRLARADAIALNTWRHIAFVAVNNAIALHIDGQLIGSAAVGLAGVSGSLSIGNPDPDTEGFSGQIDQLMVFRAALPEAALRLAALNQGTGSRSARMISISDGEVATRSALSEAGGYIAIIINSITTEGWAILVMLAGMSIFSWIIMGLKLMQLNDATRANKQFVGLWHHVAYDLAVLDNDRAIETLGGDLQSERVRAMRRAPLFKLYRTGVEEVRHRLRDNSKGAFRLSGAAMQSIRASIDRTFTGEFQQLHSKIVYLTISISGGPFLGLLGTVLGVTITFAAIAAAGDVNINSIAPGVAAALTTTIAGLLVAIPALFGYNYFVIRIRNLVAEMRVFTDEFVTKCTEFYSKKGGMGSLFEDGAAGVASLDDNASADRTIADNGAAN